MAGSSLTTLLQEQAIRQPDATAYTFIDYEVDPTGYAESLTWAQVHRRAQVVIPTTTSGKIRRSACVECYRQGEFERLGVTSPVLDIATRI